MHGTGWLRELAVRKALALLIRVEVVLAEAPLWDFHRAPPRSIGERQRSAEQSESEEEQSRES